MKNCGFNRGAHAIQHAYHPAKIIIAVMLFALSLTFGACGSQSQLKITDTAPGTGELAARGANVQVHYTGWLYADGKKGKKIDSSLDGGQPFAFTLGAGQVIEGWDKGIENMRAGGKRELIIPPQMGYGEQGAPPDIPPNATLIFEVQLLSVRK